MVSAGNGAFGPENLDYPSKSVLDPTLKSWIGIVSACFLMVSDDVLLASAGFLMVSEGILHFSYFSIQLLIQLLQPLFLL